MNSVGCSVWQKFCTLEDQYRPLYSHVFVPGTKLAFVYCDTQNKLPLPKVGPIGIDSELVCVCSLFAGIFSTLFLSHLHSKLKYPHILRTETLPIMELRRVHWLGSLVLDPLQRGWLCLLMGPIPMLLVHLVVSLKPLLSCYMALHGLT